MVYGVVTAGLVIAARLMVMKVAVVCVVVTAGLVIAAVLMVM